MKPNSLRHSRRSRESAGWRRNRRGADHRPVAVIKTPQGPGRKISECIALAKAYEEKLGYAPVADPNFAQDVQAAIDAHGEPLNQPAWD
jgi:hypothetical protein